VTRDEGISYSQESAKVQDSSSRPHFHILSLYFISSGTEYYYLDTLVLYPLRLPRRISKWRQHIVRIPTNLLWRGTRVLVIVKKEQKCWTP